MTQQDMLAATREAVLQEAQLWLGTPYRHQASTRNVGCDCLGLVRGIWRALYGNEPKAMPAYTADWAELHRGEEPLLEAAQTFMTDVPFSERNTGDLVLFRWRADAPVKHAGILLDPDRFIHAYEGNGVVKTHLGVWRSRVAGVFHFPLIEAGS